MTSRVDYPHQFYQIGTALHRGNYKAPAATSAALPYLRKPAKIQTVFRRGGFCPVRNREGFASTSSKFLTSMCGATRNRLERENNGFPMCRPRFM